MSSYARVKHRLKTDPDYRAKRYARSAASHKKRMSDPVKQEHERKVRRARQDRLRKNPETWVRRTLINVKARAARKNIPFEISQEDLIIPEVCPILLLPFTFGVGINPLNPSVDRKVPALGYVKGNVRVISHRANLMKCDRTDPEELRRLADYMEGKI